MARSEVAGTSIWDSSLLPEDEQFEYYHDVICRAFVPLLPIPVGKPKGFAAKVQTREFGEINRASITSPIQATQHGPAEVAATDKPYYFVNLQLSGQCRTEQRGNESIVGPGQLTVLDTTEPFYLDFDADWRMLSFRVPHDLLNERFAGMQVPLGSPIGPHGAGAAAISLISTLWSMDESLPHPAVSDLSLAFAATVAGAVANHRPASAELAGDGVRALIIRYLYRNLADPALSVVSVSRTFGLSPRALHALFDSAEQPFAATLRSMRMRRAVELLRAGVLTVTAVGESVGYPEPSSFGRAFRRATGRSPRSYWPAHKT